MVIVPGVYVDDLHVHGSAITSYVTAFSHYFYRLYATIHGGPVKCIFSMIHATVQHEMFSPRYSQD